MALVAVASVGLVWAFSSVYQDPAIGISLALPILGWRSVHRFRIPTKTCLARFPFAGSWNDLVCRPCFLESLSRHRRLSLGSTALSCHGSAALSQESCWYCTAIFTTPRYYTDYQTTQESVPSPEVLRLYIREHQQNRHYLLTQESGWRELEESLQLRLLRHRGTLYLVKITWENQEPPSSF